MQPKLAGLAFHPPRACLFDAVALWLPHLHRLKASALRVGLPFFSIGPGLPRMRAQKLFFRLPPPGCGALRWVPCARLYARRPLAVSPPLRLSSPLPNDNDLTIARDWHLVLYYVFACVYL